MDCLIDLLINFKIKATNFKPLLRLDMDGDDDDDKLCEVAEDDKTVALAVSLFISNLSFKIITSVSITRIFSIRLATSFLDTCGESSAHGK